jgi:glutamate--cysteine ligase
MNGKLPALPGQYPTIDDWEAHMTTAFPEVRLKRYLEMRGADCGSFEHIMALSALWVGLLYDESALKEATSLVEKWTQEERSRLRRDVPKTGLKTELRPGVSVLDVAREVVKISANGLKARKLGEEKYLEPLEEIVRTGKTNSDRLLELYEKEWKGDINKIYDEMKYY